MNANLSSRQKILASINELLCRKNLTSIKVTALVKMSGISHQTFYRYFLDKYDAAEQACYECLHTARMVVGADSTVKDQTVCILNIVKSHSAFFKHLLADPEGDQIIAKSLTRLSNEEINFRSPSPITSAWVYCLKVWNDSNYTIPVDEMYMKIISCYPIGEVVFGPHLKQLLEKYGSYTMSELDTLCNSRPR